MASVPGATEAAALKFVRDNPGSTAAKIADALQIKLRRPETTEEAGNVYLSEVLDALEAARLVTKKVQGKSVTYAVTDLWSAVQRTLQVSLTELALRAPGSMSVRPFFGAPARQRSSLQTAFVVMPFGKPMDPVYEAIRKALIGHEIRAVRGNDLYAVNERAASGGRVIDEIWSAMTAAQMILADCTGRNPNVMYELGIAHTLGKPTLLFTQAEKDIPFDIRHLRYIVYKNDAAGLDRLELEIDKCLVGKPSSR